MLRKHHFFLYLFYFSSMHERGKVFFKNSPFQSLQWVMISVTLLTR